MKLVIIIAALIIALGAVATALIVTRKDPRETACIAQGGHWIEGSEFCSPPPDPTFPDTPVECEEAGGVWSPGGGICLF